MTQKNKASLQLVSLHDGKLVINAQAAQIFASNDNPLFIISACGEYRTGKSFLLNSLFSHHGLFNISPTIEPCTQGINILQTPIKYETQQYGIVHLWVIDSEGFGSMERDSIYDSKIFLLILMLSDMLIYNSKGALDEETISRFALICQQALSLAQDSDSFKNSIQPKLCWVLRDFALTLQDQKGNEISANQYLQLALSAHLGNAQTQKTFLQRKIIKQIFNKRECLPLVRPCISEKSLNTLHSIDPIQKGQISDSFTQEIREEFLDGIHCLKDQIYRSVQPKYFTSKSGEKIIVNGNFFIKMLEQFVQAINCTNFSGGLSVQWEQIMQTQYEHIAEATLSKITNAISDIQKEIPLQKTQFAYFKEKVLNLTNQSLNSIHLQSIRLELQREVDMQLKQFFSKNKESLKNQLLAYLKNQTTQFEHKMMSLSTLSNFRQKIKGQINKIRQSTLQRFECFFVSESITTEISIQVQKYLNKFWQTLMCNLVKKWGDQTGKHELTFDELKHKNLELQQQIKQINISSQQNNSKQLNKLRAKNEEMMRNMKNYNEVIDRMENVNESLKKQFELVMASEQDVRKTFEEEKRKLEEKILDIENTCSQLKEENNIYRFELRENEDLKCILQANITSLKEKIKLMESDHQEERRKSQKMIIEKNQGMMQVLQNQRSKYQQMMNEWKCEQQSLKSEIAERDRMLEKVRQQSSHISRSLSSQMEEIIQQNRLETEKTISLMKEEFQSAFKEKEEIKVENAQLVIMLKNKQEQIFQIQNCLEISRKQIKAVESQYKNLQGEKHSQIMKMHEKMVHMEQEIKIKEEKLSLSAKEISELNHKYQQQITKLCEKLQESNQSHEKNNKTKENFLRKEFELEKSEIAAKLNEAAQRMEKLQNKNTALLKDIENYRDQNTKLRRKFKQLDALNSDCEECFRLQLEMKGLRQNIKNLSTANVDLRYALENKQNQLLNLQKINQIRQQEQHKDSTPESDECPEQFTTPKKRILDFEYFQNFSRSPIIEHKRVTKSIEDEKQMLLEMFKKKQNKHQEVITMYKEKIESLIVANQKLRGQISKKDLEVEQLQKKVEKLQEKQAHNSSKDEFLTHQLKTAEFSTDYDSLTSELKNKISELTSENRKIRNILQEQRSKTDQLQRESFKIVNLHALMKKSRNEEVENILKQNAQLKAEMEKIKEKLSVEESPNLVLHNRINELLELNSELNQEVQELSLKIKSFQRKKRELEERNEESEELVNIQKEELSKLITHYQEKITHLRISKQENRTHLQRQLTLLKRQLQISKADFLQLRRTHEKLISKKQQELMNRTKETGIMERSEEKIVLNQSGYGIKNYKDRLNKLFN